MKKSKQNENNSDFYCFGVHIENIQNGLANSQKVNKTKHIHVFKNTGIYSVTKFFTWYLTYYNITAEFL